MSEDSAVTGNGVKLLRVELVQVAFSAQPIVLPLVAASLEIDICTIVPIQGARSFSTVSFSCH